MTEDELAIALQKALTENIENRPDGFRTTRELSDKTGLNKRIVLERLRGLKSDGRLEAKQVYVENLVGMTQKVWAYRLVENSDVSL